MDLIPPALIVARYFAEEQEEIEEIEDLETKREAAERELEEFLEEHSGEEGLLEDAKTETGTVTKASVSARLKEIKKEKDSDDEKAALARCLQLLEAEADAASEVKEAQEALDANVLAKYDELSEAEIKTLVVEDKWLTSIRAAIEGEVQRVIQALAGRVTELEERYAAPLKQIEDDVAALSGRVEQHLRAMGMALA